MCAARSWERPSRRPRSRRHAGGAGTGGSGRRARVCACRSARGGRGGRFSAARMHGAAALPPALSAAPAAVARVASDVLVTCVRAPMCRACRFRERSEGRRPQRPHCPATGSHRIERTRWRGSCCLVPGGAWGRGAPSRRGLAGAPRPSESCQFTSTPRAACERALPAAGSAASASVCLLSARLAEAAALPCMARRNGSAARALRASRTGRAAAPRAHAHRRSL